VGDEYFPLYGNGGYDVKHYLLEVSYDPATDRLAGVATISARATQNLSRFNLDFVGLTVRSIKVNGRPAAWSRTDHELTVTPAHG
jgi:aminopeptidase N